VKGGVQESRKSQCTRVTLGGRYTEAMEKVKKLSGNAKRTAIIRGKGVVGKSPQRTGREEASRKNPLLKGTTVGKKSRKRPSSKSQDWKSARR